MAWNIRQYISFLQSTGKDNRRVWQLIKKNDRYKNTTNLNIQRAIDAVNQSKANARSFVIRDPKKTLGSIKGVLNQSGSDNRTVSFTFTFNPTSGKNPKGGRSQTRFMSIDVKLTDTKKEIMEKIKAVIKDWISSNYEARSSSYAIASITITSIW